MGEFSLQSATTPDLLCRKPTRKQENQKMGQVVYLGLCLLSCLLLNPSVEGAENDTVVEGRARCPTGALYYKKFCYQFVNNYVSWHLAEVRCQNSNYGPESHLASILSASEGKILASYLSSKGASNVWIGLEATRNTGYMVWGWSDDSSITWPLWDGRSLSSAISSQECIAMINFQNSNSQKWVQRGCADTLPYLCKFRADY